MSNVIQQRQVVKLATLEDLNKLLKKYPGTTVAFIQRADHNAPAVNDWLTSWIIVLNLAPDDLPAMIAAGDIP